MLRALEFRLMQTGRALARVFGLTLVAAFLLLAGLGFLSLAGWFWLESLFGPLVAALILAGANLCAALLAVVLGRPRPGQATPLPPAGTEPAAESADAAVPALMQAFFAGFRAGAGDPPGPRDTRPPPGT
jgi:hypothetical protein